MMMMTCLLWILATQSGIVFGSNQGQFSSVCVLLVCQTYLYSGVSTSWHGQCVKDNNQRLLPVEAKLGVKNTPTECVRKCKGYGYAYAGVQYGSQCFCANTPPPTNTIVDKTECNMQCSGDWQEKCGGSWRMNVYATGTVYFMFFIQKRKTGR